MNAEEVHPEDTEDGIQILKLNSLDEFIRRVWSIYSSEDVIFRGQRCNWSLVPSVGRKPPDGGIGTLPKWRWPHAEKRIFDEFTREALPYLSIVPVTDGQWLAVAQHNRLPTRLLDWSTSPLVALWFAVSEQAPVARKEEPAIVWAYCYRPKEDVATPSILAHPFSIGKPYVYFPEHLFPYIQAQSGVFTVHHREAPKGEAPEGEFVPFERTTPGARRNLTRIEIQADSVEGIRYQLLRLGIHQSILFPGLYGLVERIKFQNEMPDDEWRGSARGS